MVMFRQKLLCTLCLSMMAVGRVSSYYLEIYTTVNEGSTNPVISSNYQKALFTSMVQIVWCETRTQFFEDTKHSHITLPLPANDLKTSGDENFLQIKPLHSKILVANLGTHQCNTRRRAQAANTAAAFDAAIANPAFDAAEADGGRKLSWETCCMCLYYGACPDNDACNSDGHCTGARKLRALTYHDCNLTQDIVQHIQQIFAVKYERALNNFGDSAMFSFLKDTTVHVDLMCPMTN